MNFVDFVNNSVATNKGVILLKEGIDHIESLPTNEFIDVIRNINKFIVTEKLDGSNLIFGFTNNGEFYTSREAKGAQEKITSVSQYEESAKTNGFKSAHMALDSIKNILHSVISNGEAVEVEVLYGKQPNAIVYGSNAIAFLRMIPGENKQLPNQSKIKELEKATKGKKITISVPIVTTVDGIELMTKKVEQTWRFASTSQVDTSKFDINLSKQIEELQRFLRSKNPIGNLNLTNGDIIGLKLTTVKNKETRAALKAEREKLTTELETKFKLPIKEELLNRLVRKLKPKLRDIEIPEHLDIGIEGVVLLDPKTLKQFKIVDKDVFTIVNQFNFAVRNQLKSTGPRSKSDVNIEIRNDSIDLFNSLMGDIGNVLGIERLYVPGSIKRFVRSNSGENSSETINNISTKIPKYSSIKPKLVSLVSNGLTELNTLLKNYNKEYKSYKMTLKTGKEVTYNEAIHERTLMFFAELRKELKDLLDKISESESEKQLVVILFGKAIKEIH